MHATFDDPHLVSQAGLIRPINAVDRGSAVLAASLGQQNHGDYPPPGPRLGGEVVRMVIETGEPVAEVAGQAGRAFHACPICRIRAG